MASSVARIITTPSKPCLSNLSQKARFVKTKRAFSLGLETDRNPLAAELFEAMRMAGKSPGESLAEVWAMRHATSLSFR
jgi:hypothetical protein